MSDSDLCGDTVEDENLARMRWWAERLRNAPDYVALPFDRGRPITLSAERGRVVMPMTAGDTAGNIGLDEVGLLVACAALLYRYTSVDDLVVGAATDGE